MDNQIKEVKVVFVGNANVGKSYMRKKLLLGPDCGIPKYVATLSVEVNTIEHNGYTFYIWDTAGQEKYSGLTAGYYIKGKVFFIFHGNENGFKTPEQWEEGIKRIVADAVIFHIYEGDDVQDVLNDLDTYISVCNNNA